MQPVLTATEMQNADKAAIESLRIGEARLMELAGRECVRVICKTLDRRDLDGTVFLVVCGKGNNGGDGFVITRHLLNIGASVDLVLLYPEESLSGINSEGFGMLLAYGSLQENLRIFRSHDEALPFVAETTYDVLVDAMTGTGFRLSSDKEQLSGPLSHGIELLNNIRERSQAMTVAVDIPSGLDATSGFSAIPCVIADVTVTMAFLKTGFFLNDGPRSCGETEIAEISIPRFLVEPAGCLLVDAEFAASRFILREPSSAKHTNGKVLIVAGSRTENSSMLGAAILSAKAAVKTGAGYVCVSIPTELSDAMHASVPEAIVIGRKLETVIEKALWADAIVIGCGLGRDAETVRFTDALLSSEEIAGKKLIIDADALHSLSGRGLPLATEQYSDVLLTPHYGELSRLCGLSSDAIAANPIETARDVALRYSVSLLLKGNPTVLASAEGSVLLCTSGTEALAAAGSGDVLSGMIAAIAAKGADLRDAGAAAAWFHGRAGDLADDVSSLVSSGMVIDSIHAAIHEVFELHG
ncbi:MAG: NAD(P)H-hydrate dehydratase [Chlorobiaceae bacterium]|nr:NAD(P)H-hydrate dehydratase [Chlorobiaceae bacterium]NTV60674.1 NAD(P)H-hydrate dehydratase [Chlorobiaceae bacterium]